MHRSSNGRHVWFMAAVAALVAGATPGRAAIPEDRALLLYNSQNADSLAVRNAYIAAHPGVRQLNLNDASVTPGGISRANYSAKVRAPLLAHLAGMGPGGVPLNQHVIAIVTTRGLPARVDGGGEFTIECAIASFESELTLVQQDLDAPGQANLANRFHSLADNPYHRQFGMGIDGFSRAGITTQRAFTYVNPGVWQVSGLTPGDMYLVCRLDSAPTPGGASALQNTLALIERSRAIRLDPCAVQSLLDEYGCANHLDDDAFTFLFPGFPDFENARNALQAAGHSVLYDNTSNFISAPELLPDTRPLLAFGSYGENHSLVHPTICPGGGGENPAGNGVYPSEYTYHPAAAFISYESFNGNSIIDGMPRSNQAQVLDFIARGGSFTVGSIAEPFTFSVADMEGLTRSLYVNRMTFAEAAYIAMPGLSWMQTPVGDPLAVVSVGAGLCDGDANSDGLVNFVDLNAVLSAFGSAGTCLFGDVNRDLAVDFTDLNIVLSAFGGAC